MGSLILFILKGISYSYALQPRAIQLFWGKCLGLFLYKIRFRARVVQENLSRAFPLDLESQDRLFLKSYLHLGNLILEILLVLGPMRKFILKYMTIEGVENITEARSKGKGIIFLASHLGNWEIMAAAGGAMTESDLMMVTKQIKPDWLHHAIKKGRLRCQVRATYEPRTLKDVLGHLKKNGAVGIVLDQYVGPPVGVRVAVFETPVGTSMLVATLAKRTGAAVLPVVNYRNPDGTWVLEVHSPLVWEQYEDPQYELAANTATYASVIEKSIFRFPDQWLWTHRRFKGNLEPLGLDEWTQGRVRK